MGARRSALLQSGRAGVRIHRRLGYILPRQTFLPGYSISMCLPSVLLATYDIERLRSSFADEWPRNGGNALGCWNMAILAIAQQVKGSVIWYRHGCECDEEAGIPEEGEGNPGYLNNSCGGDALAAMKGAVTLLRVQSCRGTLRSTPLWSKLLNVSHHEHAMHCR